jgi:hypothetical protein
MAVSAVRLMQITGLFLALTGSVTLCSVSYVTI